MNTILKHWIQRQCGENPGQTARQNLHKTPYLHWRNFNDVVSCGQEARRQFNHNITYAWAGHSSVKMSTECPNTSKTIGLLSLLVRKKKLMKRRYCKLDALSLNASSWTIFRIHISAKLLTITSVAIVVRKQQFCCVSDNFHYRIIAYITDYLLSNLSFFFYTAVQVCHYSHNNHLSLKPSFS